MQKRLFDHSYYRQNVPLDLAIGLVTDCNPAGLTVDVQMETGPKVNNVPIMNLYGTAVGNELTWVNNYRGATVAIIRLGNQHYVLGTLPTRFSHYYTDADKSKIESGDKPAIESTYGQSLLKSDFGGGDPNYQKAAGKDFSGGRPSDFLPGDKVLSNDVGSSVGLFKEGIVRLFASPLAQLVLGKYKDFCRLVAKRFQGYFDFGEVNVTSDDKGTSLQILGGASYSDEAKPSDSGEEKWTVRMVMGNYVSSDKTDMDTQGEFTNPEAAASRFYLRVNNPDNSEYSGLMMDTGGNLTIRTSKDKTETNHQNRQIQVDQDELRYIGNDRILEVDNDEGISVIGDATKTVQGDWADNCSGTRKIAAKQEITIQSDVAITIKAPKVNIIRG